MDIAEENQIEREEGKVINTFNIEKGSVVFAVTAPNAVQNIYGNYFTIAACTPEVAKAVSDLNRDELKLFRFIPDITSLHEFIAQIGKCESAHDVALMAWRRLDNIYITKDNIVTAEFIESLHPFIGQIKSGTSTDNLRCHINKLIIEKKA